jgi:hypothetical protein
MRSRRTSGCLKMRMMGFPCPESWGLLRIIRVAVKVPLK